MNRSDQTLDAFLREGTTKKSRTVKTVALSAVGVATIATVALVALSGEKTLQTGSMILAVPQFWNRTNYENYVQSCFVLGDTAAAGTYDYKLYWNSAVNNCLYTMFGTSTQSAQSVPADWGNYDYTNFINACYAKGDVAAAGKGGYYTYYWNTAVNTCMKTMFKSALVSLATDTTTTATAATTAATTAASTLIPWTKEDYKFAFSTCYEVATSTLAGSKAANDLETDATKKKSAEVAYTKLWEEIVNNCIGLAACEKGAKSAINVNDASNKKSFDDAFAAADKTASEKVAADATKATVYETEVDKIICKAVPTASSTNAASK